MQKSIAVISEFTGKPPRGWAAPTWTPSLVTARWLEECGLIYDHSFLRHDSQIYLLSYPPKNWTETDYKNLSAGDCMTPMSSLRPSTIVEIPANWHLDNWPVFQTMRR